MPDHGSIKDYSTRQMMTWVKKQLRDLKDAVGRTVQEGIVRIENASSFGDITCDNITVNEDATVGDDLGVTGDITAATLTTTGNANVGTDLTVDGEMKGTRVSIPFWYVNTFSSDGTLSRHTWVGGTAGYPVPRDCSIVSMTVMYYWAFETTSGSMTYKINKNNGTILSAPVVTINTPAPGNYTRGYTTQARGVTTLSAGDYIAIAVYFDGSTAGSISRTMIDVELQFDT